MRTVQQIHCRLHLQHLPLRLGLSVGADEDAFLSSDRTEAVGAQLKAFAARLFVGVDQVAEVELTFAAVLGASLMCSLPRSSSRRSLLLDGVRSTLRR